MSRRATDLTITPELMLRAYAAGIFPMAESRSAEATYWVDPKQRGILPLNKFHVSRSLRKTVRRKKFDVRCNTNFAEVIRECSQPAFNRKETWINDSISRCVNELAEMGFAHSVACWAKGKLVGGLYGIALGAVFFGESMFSRETDASKVALVHLVARLRLGGFKLLDTQFVTDHLSSFGAEEIPARDYLVLLEDALKFQALFPTNTEEASLRNEIESIIK